MKKRHNIGFLLMNEHSVYNAALGLARALQERGQNVLFFVPHGTMFSQYVNAHGFKVVNFLAAREPGMLNSGKRRSVRLWDRFKEHSENVRWKQSCMSELMKSNSLDLCFIDFIRDDVYLYVDMLCRLGIPTILLSYTFASRFSTEYPPVFSSMLHVDSKSPSALSRIVYASLWIWAIATDGRAHTNDVRESFQELLKKLLSQLVNLTFEPRMRKLGWRSEWGEYKRRPLLPEVVFGHRALDWAASASRPERFYFGATDLLRKSPAFDWSMIDEGKPIICCSISTARGFARTKTFDMTKTKARIARRYLEAIIEAFTRRTDWQLIVGCGPFLETLRSRVRSPNIHVFETLPQLAVLDKADLAITWGGAGALRECISFGVPMLIFPAWSDQFGNAARASSRNVGIRGDMRDVTPTKIMEMVEKVLSDTKIRASVHGMQSQCDVRSEIEGLMRFVGCHTGLEL
jgi:hypothetical protein